MKFEILTVRIRDISDHLGAAQFIIHKHRAT